MAESVDAPDLKSVDHYGRGSSSLPTRITLNTFKGISCMKYRIDSRYVWYDRGARIVLMYFIQGLPFTRVYVRISKQKE